jgi:hypothetical protein
MEMTLTPMPLQLEPIEKNQNLSTEISAVSSTVYDLAPALT